MDVLHRFRTLTSKSFYELFWCLIIIELIFSGILLFDFIKYPAFFITSDYIVHCLSCFTAHFLELYFLKDSYILLLFALLPIVLKIICSIGIFKHKKFFSFFAFVLYLLDFLSSVYRICFSEIRLYELTTPSALTEFLECFFIGVISGLFLLGYYVFDKNEISIKRINKRSLIPTILYSTIVLLTITFTFGLSYCEKYKISATPEEIELLNKCYAYSESYLYNDLPEDRETLETISSDIDSIIETDIFKRGFNQSKFNERFVRRKNSDEEDYFGPKVEKSKYANELMFLKCRVLLALDENEEFQRYYNAKKQYFTVSTETFFNHIEKTSCFFYEDDVLVIDEFFRDAISSEEEEKYKFIAWATLVELYSDRSDYEENFKPELQQLRDDTFKSFGLKELVGMEQDLVYTKNSLYF